MAQFHRYLHLRDEADIVAFEDRCALGLPAEIQIDFTISASELPGYKRLVQDSAEWKVGNYIYLSRKALKRVALIFGDLT